MYNLYRHFVYCVYSYSPTPATKVLSLSPKPPSSMFIFQQFFWYYCFVSFHTFYLFFSSYHSFCWAIYPSSFLIIPLFFMFNSSHFTFTFFSIYFYYYYSSHLFSSYIFHVLPTLSIFVQVIFNFSPTTVNIVFNDYTFKSKLSNFKLIIDAPPSSLMDSTVSPKVKTMEEERIEVRFLACSTVG